MKPQFSHEVLNSFILWFDYISCFKGEAFQTYTTKFYNYSDPLLTEGNTVYASPFKQWVYNKSIPNVTIPSGLTINGTFVSTGTSGLFFDFENGRAIFNSGVPTNLNITGTYSVKEFNTYVSEDSEDSLIIDNKYEENNRFTVNQSGITPYNPVTPAVFFSIESQDNTPFALGGMDLTEIKIKGVAFCDDLYQLDGLMGLFSDRFNSSFKIIPFSGNPIGEFGKIKTGIYPNGFDYTQAVTNGGFSNPLYISDINTSKMRDDVQKELNPRTYIGFLEFYVNSARYPRI